MIYSNSRVFITTRTPIGGLFSPLWYPLLPSKQAAPVEHALVGALFKSRISATCLPVAHKSLWGLLAQLPLIYLNLRTTSSMPLPLARILYTTLAYLRVSQANFFPFSSELDTYLSSITTASSMKCNIRLSTRLTVKPVQSLHPVTFNKIREIKKRREF